MARNQPCTPTLVKLRKLVPGLAKNAPCFANSGCVPGLCPEEKFMVTTFIHSATPTNFIAGPLWLIAHNLHVRQFTEQLTITEKAEMFNRDNSYLSTWIGYLDKFRTT